MRTLVRGEIIDFVPVFNAYLSDGVLIISEDGDFSLTVDTGFSGGVALPEETLGKMNVEFFGYDTFSLATGEVVELPMSLGIVILGGREIETWFIPGDSLLGVEFLASAGSGLSLNFRNSVVKLTR